MKLAWLPLAGLALCACKPSAPAPSTDDVVDPAEPSLVDLEQQERALRASTDWATFPSSDTTLGHDPIEVIAAGDGMYFGALRGSNKVMLLDEQGRIERWPGPRAPRALAFDEHAGVVHVGGELSDTTQAFIAANGVRSGLRPGYHRPRAWPVRGMRGVAIVDGKPVWLDVDGALVWSTGEREEGVAVGGYGLRSTPRGWLAILDVLGHRVIVRQGALSVALAGDAPVLGMAVRDAADGAVDVAIGLIEDHPLDRTGGSFGFIDSFLRVFRVDATGAIAPLRELNLSEHGIVTPKALAFVDDDTVLVAGAGSGRAARVSIATGAVSPVPSLPGVVSLAPTKHGFIGASPLLDAWVVVDERGARRVDVGLVDEPRSVSSKLGEALVFTTLMAPRQQSDGPLSRFTCEACHFEGTIDGRVHHTGRGDVRATTRPLLGLFNNKPLFTRALDPNITRMVHAEFGVANANSALDPWFALTPADAPWLSLLGVSGTQSPVELRKAVSDFLRDFTPRTNPRVVGRSAFGDDERKGAELFAQHCARCHAPRLIGDDPSTTQPPAQWERLVLSDNGPLVWSSPERHRTGIEPYVHEEGARSSSLRRISRKVPYFTNGSARTLDEVVSAARFSAGVNATFLHLSNREALARFSDEERSALVAFLKVL